MMTKNNMWRDSIKEMYDKALKSDVVQINWINMTDSVLVLGLQIKNLQWEELKKIYSHPISLFVVAMAGPTYKDYPLKKFTKEQKYTLKDCTGTDYGTINKDGVYNVPDQN